MPRYAQPIPAPPAKKAVSAPGAGRQQPNRAAPQRAAIRHALQLKAARSAPPSAGSENRSGLPGPLQTGIEQLSGIAMDDVRVHRDSPEPATLGALAFAKGTDIHLGPGQERHLPHEAWHVVQQKQGRVRPNLQLRGRAQVNNDTALEAEADTMGARALSASAAGADAAPPIHCAEPAGVVQRAIGFEFESGNAIADANKKTKDLSKDHVYEGTDFHIDADTKNKKGHNIEFVTDHKETAEEAETIIEAMVKFAQTLKTGPVEKGDGWKDDYVLSVNDTDWTATMQHTEGVLLADMAAFLKRSLENADKFSSHAKGFTKLQKDHQGAGLNDEVKGLIHLVLHYLRTLKAWDGKQNEEGPKNAGPIMSRTDFNSIYLSLSKTQQDQFKARIGTDITAAGFGAGDPLIPKAYLQYDGSGKAPELKKNEVTIAAWLASIREGSKLQKGGKVAKDLMSPPEGYETFADPAYSMGAMEMDGDRVIIEVRDHGDFSNMMIDEWPDAPRLVAAQEE